MEGRDGDVGREVGVGMGMILKLWEKVCLQLTFERCRGRLNFERLRKAIPEGRGWRSEGAVTKAFLANVIVKAWNGEVWPRLELFQGQHWGNSWEMGCSAYDNMGLPGRIDTILNWTELDWGGYMTIDIHYIYNIYCVNSGDSILQNSWL